MISIENIAFFSSIVWLELSLIYELNHLPFLTRYVRKFVWAGRRKMVDSQRPFHTLTHLMPTNQLLCCTPIKNKHLTIRDNRSYDVWLYNFEIRWISLDLLTLLRIISGAKYSGVPQSVQVRPLTRFAKPKSVIWKCKL